MFKGMDYIYEIYKAGSISRAAQNLYISQPSLSASLKRVEEKIGYPLFDRGVKPLRLTEYGKEYIAAVLQIKNIENQFEAYINDLGELKTGSVRLGGTNMFASFVLPSMIMNFHADNPHITYEVIEETTLGLEELLRSGQLDIAVDNFVPDDDAFDYKPVGRESLILTVPAHLAVNERIKEYRIAPEAIRDRSFLSDSIPAVPLKYFEHEPFVLLKTSNDTRRRAESMCRDCGFEPSIIYESEQQTSSYHVCCSGIGIAFISTLLLDAFPANENIYYYKLDSPLSHRQYYFIWKKGRYVTRVMREFLNLAV